MVFSVSVVHARSAVRGATLRAGLHHLLHNCGDWKLGNVLFPST